jgi:hypothetical protein
MRSRVTCTRRVTSGRTYRPKTNGDAERWHGADDGERGSATPYMELSEYARKRLYSGRGPPKSLKTLARDDGCPHTCPDLVIMAARTSSPPTTYTIAEYAVRDLVSVRPYSGSLKPVGVAHGVTPRIEPLAAEASPVRSRGHRVKHDSRMLDRPQRPVGAVNVLILAARSLALIPQPPGNAYTSRADLPRSPR